MVIMSPAPASTNNPVNSIIEIQFNEPLDPATVNSANVPVHYLGTGAPIAGTLSVLNGNRTIRFRPAVPLQPASYYYIYLQAGLHDAQGTPIVPVAPYFYTSTTIDTAPPSILSIAPGNGATNVGINASVRVHFNEPINPLSATPASVTLSTAAGPVPVTFVFSDNNTILRIVPQNPLPANALVTLSVDPYDIAGNELPAVQSQFTTATGADTTPPSVVNANWTVQPDRTGEFRLRSGVQRAHGRADGVVQQGTFLYDARFGGYVAGTLSGSADARTFTFTPSAPLAVNRPYSAQLYGALDLAGNVSTGFNSYTITDYGSDTAAPTVVNVNPLDGATGMPRNAKIRVLFSEPIAVDTAGHVRLLLNGTPVSVSSTVTNGNRLVTLTPNALLASNTVYTISVSQVRDTSGNLQTPAFTSAFTTGNDADLIAPVITRYTPAYGQWVPQNVSFRVTFSEPINPTTIDSSNFFIYNPAGQPAVPAVISISSDGRSATLTPSSPLLPNNAYIAQIYSFADSAGNVGSGVSL